MQASLWKRNKHSQAYRNISQDLDSGLYALSQINVIENKTINIQTEKELIRQDLENCINLLKQLSCIIEDPSDGSIEKVHMIDSTDLTKEMIEKMITELTIATISFTTVSEEVSEKLLELEAYAKRKAEQKIQM